MNKTKTRCLSLALVIGVVALFAASVATAQVHSTGITVSKSCPGDPVDVGTVITCSYTITNSGDTAHGYTILTATETAPCTVVNMMTGECAAGGGIPFDVLTPSMTNSGCLQGDPPAPVTFLGPAGTATASCSGTFQQTVPSTCNPEPTTILDKVQVSGTDAGQFLPAFGNYSTNIINVNPEVCNEGEFCRTKGFWGSHTNETDATCAQNITQAVIDAGGPLNICGELLCTTVADDASSAVEALCNTGGGERQLAAQLTAAALNCIVTNGSASCDGVSINDAFDECNAACALNVDADPNNNVSLGDCIGVIDCFNNGGQWDAVNDFCAYGICGAPVMKTAGGLPSPVYCSPENAGEVCGIGEECVLFANNCHDADFEDFEFVTLPNDVDEEGVCFGKPGPADPTECKAARKTDCLIWDEASCDTETACAAP